MQSEARNSRLLIVFVALIFAALALLAAFLVAGEARRSRILVEYEADRLASALAESPRSFGGEASPELDPRILGFGLYDRSGERLSGFGAAPDSLDLSRPLSAFAYDEKASRLELTRQMGMGGMMRRGQGRGFGNLDRSMRQMMGEAGPGYLYLSLDIRDYLRRRSLLGASIYVLPLLVAALAALFVRLISNNAKLRRKASDRETLARLGEGARALAHEIRNPLGAIRIQTSLLRQRLGPPAAGTAGAGAAMPELDAIDEETERLNLLSRRVGDFLKNPAGSPSELELVSFLSELASRSAYGARFSSELGEARASFDPELLRSSVDNLLRNASESYDDSACADPDAAASVGAAARGAALGDARPVELRLGREGALLALDVLDRGVGIKAEAMGRVFDPFYTDKAGGSGLGLSLARRFVEAAGGTLELSPRPGGGTRARILLPELKEGR